MVLVFLLGIIVSFLAFVLVFLLGIIVSFLAFIVSFLVTVFAITIFAAAFAVFLRLLQLVVQQLCVKQATFFACRASLHLLHTHLLVIAFAFAVAFAARIRVFLHAFHKLFAKLVLCASLRCGFELGAWFHIFLVLAIA